MRNQKVTFCMYDVIVHVLHRNHSSILQNRILTKARSVPGDATTLDGDSRRPSPAQSSLLLAPQSAVAVVELRYLPSSHEVPLPPCFTFSIRLTTSSGPIVLLNIYRPGSARSLRHSLIQYNSIQYSCCPAWHLVSIHCIYG